MFREVRSTEDRVDHIARHGVTPQEVEDVLFGRPIFAQDDPDDGSTVVLGRTAAAGACSWRCSGRTSGG